MDEDDDNDGLFDQDDPCPLNANQECVDAITDTVLVNGKEWAQPNLFTSITWNEILAACPVGKCIDGSILYGHDMTGWTWATPQNMADLFNSLIGSTILDGTVTTVYVALGHSEGLWPAELYLAGLQRTQNVAAQPNSGWVFDVSPKWASVSLNEGTGGIIGTGRVAQASASGGGSSFTGAWFYRTP